MEFLSVKILIIGSNGLIGSKIDNWGGHDILRPTCEEFNIADYGHIGKRLDEYNPDVVVNLAVNKSPVKYDKVNSVAPHFIDRWCNRNGRRYVHLSTCAVYGEGENLREDTDDSGLKPTGLYGETKRDGEPSYLGKNEIEAKNKTHPRTVILRVFNVYGLDSVVDKLIRGEYVELQDTFVRNWIHVDDVVSVIKQAVDGDMIGIYNVGGENWSNRELVERFATTDNYRWVDGKSSISEANLDKFRRCFNV
jgi:dTDP-4-dehydrorhamnose reductase